MAKPPVPHVITSHPLYTGLLGEAPLTEASGPPNNIASGSNVASSFLAGSTGTWTSPSWGTDATFGAYLSFTKSGTNYTSEVRFANVATSTTSGTIKGVFRPTANGISYFMRSGINTTFGDGYLGMDGTNRFFCGIRQSNQFGTTPITLTLNKVWALAAVYDQPSATLTLYAKNLTDGGAVLTSVAAIPDTSFYLTHTGTTGWSIGFSDANGAYQSNFDCFDAGFQSYEWTSSNFSNYVADIQGVCRPILSVSPTSVTPSVANQAFTVSTNVAGEWTNGTGTTPITATGATLNTPQTITGQNTDALSVASTGANGNTIVFTDTTYQTTVSVPVATAVAATDFTVTPPSPATGSLGSASGNFTITPNGTFTGTPTLSDGGAGGSFSAAPTWPGDSSARTFTYTPAGFAGVVTISVTMGTLNSSSPHTTTYTSTAVALAGGYIHRNAGTLTSVGFDGHAGYGNWPGVEPGGTAASGGQGVISYQWFSLPRADTTLTGSPGTAIAGATGVDLSWTGLPRFTTFNIVRRATDQTPGTNLVAWSNVEVVATMTDIKVAVAVGGDSETELGNYAEFQNYLQGPSNANYLKFQFSSAYPTLTNTGASAGSRTIPYWNTAISGTYSSQWLPASTTIYGYTASDGNTTRNLLKNAEFVLSQIVADLKVFYFMIGINDADVTSITAAQYGANLAAIAADVLANGVDIFVLGYPSEPIAGVYATAAHRQLIRDFQAQIDTLHNNTTIQATGNKLHMMTAGRVDKKDDGSGTITDPIHFNAAGFITKAHCDANAVLAAIESFIKPVPIVGGASASFIIGG